MTNSASGVLVLVIGEDHVTAQAVSQAARRSRGGERVVFPRRVVSGPPLALGEVHQTVTPAQFEELRRNGTFGLVWGGGGRNFALPASISRDLRHGCAVVAAASPAAIRSALHDYPRVAVALAGSADDMATRRMLAGCEDVARIGDDPQQAAGRLAAFVDELVGVEPSRRRPAEVWAGPGLV